MSRSHVVSVELYWVGNPCPSLYRTQWTYMQGLYRLSSFYFLAGWEGKAGSSLKSSFLRDFCNAWMRAWWSAMAGLCLLWRNEDTSRQDHGPPRQQSSTLKQVRPRNAITLSEAKGGGGEVTDSHKCTKNKGDSSSNSNSSALLVHPSQWTLVKKSASLIVN